jgi:hypothetical protein
MACPNVKECACPKKECINNGKCCSCVIRHKNINSLPFCLSVDNDRDKNSKN